MRRLRALAFTAALLAVPFAGAPALGQAKPAAPAGQALERLEIVTAQGRYTFSIELADEPQEQSRGLMERQSMASDHGMLFDFGEPRLVTMWMSNTPLSLDMVFVRPDGTVSSIAERTTPFSEAIIPSREPVSHVLEVRAGVARLIGLKAGDRLIHPSFDAAPAR